MASHSGSEEKKPRRQQQTYESEGEESEEYQSPPPRRKRNQRQKKGGQGPLDNLALDNVQNTAGGLVNSATGALGGVAGNAVQNQGGGDGGGKSDTLRLRLDLNLDIEITLKAKIHGDLELALLETWAGDTQLSGDPTFAHRSVLWTGMLLLSLLPSLLLGICGFRIGIRANSLGTEATKAHLKSSRGARQGQYLSSTGIRFGKRDNGSLGFHI